MNPIFKIAATLMMSLVLHTAHGHADEVHLNSGDRLIGIVQNAFFAVQTPYGQVVVQNGFLKALSLAESRTGRGSLKTINNDLFSGNLLNEEIQILLANKARESIDIQDLKLILFDTAGPSRPITTAIVTMRNKDRFSSTMLNPHIMVRTDFMTQTYQPDKINRIIFSADNDQDVEVQLANGDIIRGELLTDRITLAPDSMGRLTSAKSKISRIQFNARKWVLKEYDSLPPSEKDGDGDGVSDNADNCPHTAWGDAVDENGCSTGPAKTADKDGDGVADSDDKCLQSPMGAAVDISGCWKIQPILFAFGRDTIRPEYFPRLDEVIAVLEKNPDLKLEIQGHTDNVGSLKYNQKLSEKRADLVMGYFLNKGIDKDRLSAAGYSFTKPVADNSNPSGRARNRRVQLNPLR
jgi:outer membrane protein OmpA-like peptidoglycan-associated protein